MQQTVSNLKASNTYSLALYKNKFANLWNKVFLSRILITYYT